jgi:peptide/nickel transport system ATP-binding protein
MGISTTTHRKPKHPYTILLRESITEADPEKRWDNKITLSESEQEEYLRAGCKFAGRCQEAMEKCKVEVPPDNQIDGVLVKCHLNNES